jgi:hypothetical protein
VTRTVAHQIVEALAAAGASHVFGVVGTTTLPFLDALHDRDDLQYVSVRHEQVGASAADGDARLTEAEGPAVRFRTTAGVDLDIIAGKRGVIAGIMVRPEEDGPDRGGKGVPVPGHRRWFEVDLDLLPGQLHPGDLPRWATSRWRPWSIYLSIDPDSFCVFGDDGRSG